MSEQAEKSRKVRAKRWSEDEAREVVREWRESGLSTVAFTAQRPLSSTRLSYWEGHLGQTTAREMSFVAVAAVEPARERWCVRVLYWDLTTKRLQKGRFRVPWRNETGCVTVEAAELLLVLEGLDCPQPCNPARSVHAEGEAVTVTGRRKKISTREFEWAIGFYRHLAVRESSESHAREFESD